MIDMQKYYMSKIAVSNTAKGKDKEELEDTTPAPVTTTKTTPKATPAPDISVADTKLKTPDANKVLMDRTEGKTPVKAPVKEPVKAPVTPTPEVDTDYGDYDDDAAKSSIVHSRAVDALKSRGVEGVKAQGHVRRMLNNKDNVDRMLGDQKVLDTWADKRVESLGGSEAMTEDLVSRAKKNLINSGMSEEVADKYARRMASNKDNLKKFTYNPDLARWAKTQAGTTQELQKVQDDPSYNFGASLDHLPGAMVDEGKKLVDKTRTAGQEVIEGVAISQVEAEQRAKEQAAKQKAADAVAAEEAAAQQAEDEKPIETEQEKLEREERQRDLERTPYDQQVADLETQIEEQKRLVALRGKEQSWLDEGIDTASALIKGPMNILNVRGVPDPFGIGNWANKKTKTESGARQDDAQDALAAMEDKLVEVNSLKSGYLNKRQSGKSHEQVMDELGIDDKGNKTLEGRAKGVMNWAAEHPLLAVSAGYLLYKFFAGGSGPQYQMGPMGGYPGMPQQQGNMFTRNPLLTTSGIALAGAYGYKQGWFDDWISAFTGGKGKKTEDAPDTVTAPAGGGGTSTEAGEELVSDATAEATEATKPK